ncbi:rhodanese-like domain-containing protein [Chloroflexota bacterium]
MKGKSLFALMLSVSLVIVSVSTASCTGRATELGVQSRPSQIIKDITPQQAYDLIGDNSENPDFMIIDVRTSEEFTDGHLENALNINLNSGTFSDDINKLDKDKTYLVYCRSGTRSAQAATIMEDLGFREVYDMGGITDWTAEGFSVVK